MRLQKLVFFNILLLSLSLTGCGSENLGPIDSGSAGGDSGTDGGSDGDITYTASGNLAPKIIQRGQTFTFNYNLDKTPVDEAVIYDIDIVGTAVQGATEDYTISNSSTLTFVKGSTTTSLTITTNKKDDVYDARTLSLTFTGITGEPATLNLLISGNVYLNDTGVTTYSDTTNFALTSQAGGDYALQDAAYGLDVIINSDATANNGGDSQDTSSQFYKNNRDVDVANQEYKGKAGFRFVKMHNNGMPLPATSTNYSCVKDEITGLTWQVKSTYNPLNNPEKDPTLPEFDRSRYHASNFLYPWEASALSGVGPGWHYGSENNENGPFTMSTDPEDFVNNACGYNRGYGNRDFDLYCASGSYANETNFLKVCGKSNWVVPTVEQLRGIINYEKVSDYAELASNKHGLDETFFDCHAGDCVIAKTVTAPLYWTSSSVKGAEGLAWCINLQSGIVQTCNKQEYHNVMVVSSNIPADFFNPSSDDSTATDEEE